MLSFWVCLVTFLCNGCLAQGIGEKGKNAIPSQFWGYNVYLAFRGLIVLLKGTQ